MKLWNVVIEMVLSPNALLLIFVSFTHLAHGREHNMRADKQGEPAQMMAALVFLSTRFKESV